MWLDILKNKKSNEIFLWHQVNSHFYFDIYMCVCVWVCVYVYIYIYIYIRETEKESFPGGSDGKESACNDDYLKPHRKKKNLVRVLISIYF